MRRGDGVGAGAHCRTQRTHKRDRRRLLRRSVALCRTEGPGGRQRRDPRAVARGPCHHQGEYRRRRTGDTKRPARVRRSHRAGPFSGDAQPARRRCDHCGAHQYSGALDARDHGQPAARPNPQSLERRGLARWIVRWSVGCRGDGVRADTPRERHRRVAALPRVRVRAGDGEADARAGARVQPECVGRARPSRPAQFRPGRDLPRGAGRAARDAGARRRRSARSVVGAGPLRRTRARSSHKGGGHERGARLSNRSADPRRHRAGGGRAERCGLRGGARGDPVDHEARAGVVRRARKRDRLLPGPGRARARQRINPDHLRALPAHWGASRFRPDTARPSPIAPR